MAIADAFDAMTTNRVYKPRLTIEYAIEEIKKCSGIQFDPEIIPFAIAYFSTIETIENTQSIPSDKVSQHRFAYFFKDALTQSYNESYLEICLHKNQIDPLYHYACLMNLHGLHQYNKTYGWKKGDQILIQLVADIMLATNNNMVFRIHGDKFVVLQESKLDNYELQIPHLDDGLQITQHSHQLDHKKIYSIETLMEYFYQ
jgi:GGDEF domain-containing protein